MMTEKKRILLTGATSGIGYATAEKLCAMGHTVTFTARDHAKADATLKALRTAVPACDVNYCILDLSCFGSVETAIAELNKIHDPFDIVILNAAVMFPEKCETKHGLEATFQVNYLSHYLLTTSLLAAKPIGHKMHFVCLSSVLLKLFNGLPWSIPKDGAKWEAMFAPKTKSGWKAYALSKFALAVFAETLNRIEDVTAVAVNPGNSSTPVTRNMKHKKFFKIFKSTLIPVEQAADNVICGALNPLEIGNFYDKNVAAPLPKAARAEHSSHLLMALSEKVLDQVVPSRKNSSLSSQSL